MATKKKSLQSLRKRFEAIEALVVRAMSEYIETMDDMDTLDLLAIFAEVGMESARVNTTVSKSVNAAVADVNAVYNAALNDTYKDRRFARALKERPLSAQAKADLESYARSVSRSTASVMRSMAQATNVSQAWQKAANDGYIAARGGVGDYKSMVRWKLKELARNGLCVQGEDGRSRRMVNEFVRVVVDGEKDIRQHTSDVISDALGFDAVEISVHVNSWPDHEPIQGRVFLKAEFEKLQSGRDCVDVDGRHYEAIERPIGALNCRHIAYGFSTKHSKRRYTNEQLDEMAARNAEGCTIDGKRYTLYEAQRYVNRLDSSIRTWERIRIAGESANDAALEMDARKRILELNGLRYDAVAQMKKKYPRA